MYIHRNIIYIYTYAFLVLLSWFLPETALILVVAGKKNAAAFQMIKNSEDERKPTNQPAAGDSDATADQLETSGLTWRLDGL